MAKLTTTKVQPMSLDDSMWVLKTVTTETAHRLVDYEGKCADIHGHSWKWELGVQLSSLRSNGISLDFGYLKDLLGRIVDDVFDHALVLSHEDPLVQRCKAEGWSLEWLMGPENRPGKVVLLDCNPTSENMALYLRNKAMAALQYDAAVTGGLVRVHETCNSSASISWRYEDES